MQTKIILALFCTIVVLLIGVNDGAPVASKPAPAKEESSGVKPMKKMAGTRSQWKTPVDAKGRKLFNDHKKIISEKLHSVHKVPTTFDPKPAKYSTQVVAGTLYHYLVKIPSNQYAHVTVHNRPWRKDQAISEANVNVRQQLYAFTDKNV